MYLQWARKSKELSCGLSWSQTPISIGIFTGACTVSRWTCFMLHETMSLLAKCLVLGTVNNEAAVEAPEWHYEIRSGSIKRDRCTCTMCIRLQPIIGIVVNVSPTLCSHGEAQQRAGRLGFWNMQMGYVTILFPSFLSWSSCPYLCPYLHLPRHEPQDISSTPCHKSDECWPCHSHES